MVLDHQSEKYVLYWIFMRTLLAWLKIWSRVEHLVEVVFASFTKCLMNSTAFVEPGSHYCGNLATTTRASGSAIWYAMKLCKGTSRRK